jgi:adenylate kinase
MKNIIIFGPPGVGKGTQAAKLVEHFGASLLHISTGNLIRQEIQTNSVFGQKLKNLVSQGLLVSDEDLFQLFGNLYANIAQKPEVQYILIDGVPRNQSQVSGLEQVLKASSQRISMILNIQADFAILKQRFTTRRYCSHCGATSTVQYVPQNPGLENTNCGVCGALNSLVWRPDDNPDIVENRFQVYNSQTVPVLDAYYSLQKPIVHLDGALCVQDLHTHIVQILENLL